MSERAAGPTGHDALDALADAFLARRRAGEEVSIESFAVAHPKLAAEIRDLFPTLLAMESVAAAGAIEQIGPYRILRELGRGGMGVVYLAEDSRLSRRVALKVLTPSLAASAQTAQTLLRFRREAEIASNLDHPSICAVYEAGESAGTAWIAMRYVEGETLAQWIERRRAAKAGVTRDDVATVLRWTEEAARALHEAHEAGLVHRDVKPGNVMIERGTDERGGRAVVLDFGLARPTESAGDATMTQTGALLGTPAYMSPEQILAARYRLDRRTDVYSLGVTLYEALTLRLPFEAATHGQLLQAILSSQPDSPRRLNPTVGSDLRVVVETAMDRERERRYATAADFAEDLRRVRGHEPIRARPAGPLLRLRRWAQRSPVLATSTAGLFVTLAVGLSVALHLLGQVSDERDARDEAIGELLVETEAKKEALDDSQRSLRTARSAALAHASLRAQDQDPMLALLLAREAVRSERTPAAVTQLHEALDGSLWRATFRVPGSGYKTVTALGFGPKDDVIAWGSRDGRCGVLDRMGRSLATMECEGAVQRIEVSFDGRHVATETESEVRLWTIDGAAVATVPGRLAAVASAADRLVVIAGDAAHVLEFSGREVSVLRTSSAVTCAAILAAGVAVKTGHADGSVLNWDAANAKIMDRYPQHDTAVRSIANAPDHQHVVTTVRAPNAPTGSAWDDCVVPRLFRGSNDEVPLSLPSSGWVRAVAFSATRLLATTQESVVWWDLRWDRQKSAMQSAPAADDRHSAISRDGNRAASWGRHASFYGPEGPPRHTLREIGQCLALSSDGRFAVSANGAELTLWACLGGELPTLEMPGGEDLKIALYLGSMVSVSVASGPVPAALYDRDGRIVRQSGTKNPSHVVLWWPALGLVYWDEAVALSAALPAPVRIEAPDGWSFHGALASPRGDAVVVVRGRADEDREAVLFDRAGREMAVMAIGRGALAWFSGSGARVVSSPDGGDLEQWIIPPLLCQLLGVRWIEIDGHRVDLAEGEICASASLSEMTLWDLEGHVVAKVGATPSAATTRDREFVVYDADGHEVRRFPSDDARAIRLGTASAAVRYGPTPWEHTGPLELETPAGDPVATLARNIPRRGGFFKIPPLPAFSHDGKRIAISPETSLIRQYLVDVDDVLRLTEERISRDLTRPELERYRPILDEHRRDELAARVLVDGLFDEVVLQADVAERIGADRSLRPMVRSIAERLTSERHDDVEVILRRSRIDLASVGATLEVLRRGHRLAQAALRMTERRDVVLNWGVARFRNGDCAGAVATLRAAAERWPDDEAEPDVVRRAFLAMALSQLGRNDEAAREIAVARAAVDASERTEAGPNGMRLHRGTTLPPPPLPPQSRGSPQAPQRPAPPRFSRYEVERLREAERLVAAAAGNAGPPLSDE